MFSKNDQNVLLSGTLFGFRLTLYGTATPPFNSTSTTVKETSRKSYLMFLDVVHKHCTFSFQGIEVAYLIESTNSSFAQLKNTKYVLTLKLPLQTGKLFPLDTIYSLYEFNQV